MRRSRVTDEGRQLGVIKSLVAAGDYGYSGKVRSLLADGWFEMGDLEHGVLGATSIYKVEDDELGVALDGRKYTILGRDMQGQRFYTCGKIILSSEGQRLYFFITAHAAD